MKNRFYREMVIGIAAALMLGTAATGCGSRTAGDASSASSISAASDTADTESGAGSSDAAAESGTAQDSADEADSTADKADTDSTEEGSSDENGSDADASDTDSSEAGSETDSDGDDEENKDGSEEGTGDASDENGDEDSDADEDVKLSADQYVSELTGLPEDKKLEKQRPVAVMIDNDTRALPHYGLADADIVYEMMNSTANKRVTRLMAIYKDWQDVDQIGNIRSTRSTNILIAPEYGAILIHDGGPFYIKTYLKSTGCPHLSGGFTRVKNGKAREFTEYAVGTEIAKRVKKAGYSTSYPKGIEKHFIFGKADLSDGRKAETIGLSCFRLTKPYLKYNAKTKTYDYYEAGKLAQDGGDKKTVSFKNVILQDVTFSQLDENGYLIYNVIGAGSGYYASNGKAIEISWRKNSETGKTTFYDQDGKEITLNAGKTYIAVCPADDWKSVTIQ